MEFMHQQQPTRALKPLQKEGFGQTTVEAQGRSSLLGCGKRLR